jgi:hypothetical protein
MIRKGPGIMVIWIIEGNDFEKETDMNNVPETMWTKGYIWY